MLDLRKLWKLKKGDQQKENARATVMCNNQELGEMHFLISCKLRVHLKIGNVVA